MMNRESWSRESEIRNCESELGFSRGGWGGREGEIEEMGVMVVSRLWNRDSRFGTRGYEPMGRGRRGWRGRKGMV